MTDRFKSSWLFRAMGVLIFACFNAVLAQPLRGGGDSPPAARPVSRISPLEQGSAVSERDGQHDFDFNFGTWKTRISRLRHPLTDSTTWVKLEGTVVMRKVWNGRAQLEEIEADGPTGHFEGLTLYLYNPQSHQWSVNFANSTDSTLSQPAIGEFKNGRGEFYDQEPFHGRAILVRIVWSDITPTSHRFEQSFSDDGGKTWESNFVAVLTREKVAADVTGVQPASMEPGQHDFDFEIGAWDIHLKRLIHPLTGSTKWVEFDGTSVTRKVWGGRANLEEFETNSPVGGYIEGLTLRLYNPKTRQWSIYWGTSKSDSLGVPTIGEFKHGIGEFYDTEPSGPNGRSILVRFVWSKITPNSAHFEQSFSDDGGKTWEVNWITDQTRVNGEPDKTH